MTTANPHERRRFTRIRFDASTALKLDGHSSPVELLDLSLKGALVALSEKLPCPVGSPVELLIELADGATRLRLPASLAHTEGLHAGFLFDTLELESLSHLRRLVELNLGDSSLLERELEQLFPQQ
ncbi:PilZ domain-containing protein [Marinobacterium arenosum]|uniref:PilZ domain-containing protein n=1 Tax=Marinobacterium arenosum TaxID=2862496 RepID=UPI0028F3E989|nr:PilZ domain-containing protein [Marinobacterium arenosum]